MAQAWRIVKASRVADAFSGEGARLFGGRWNSRGTAVVYASEHLATAALELIVHLRPLVPRLPLVAISVEIPDALIERVPNEQLPAEWRLSPAGPATWKLGDAWVRESRSAVLALPSVIVPEEINFLLNPAHPDIHRVVVGKANPFAFDPRLLGR